jgi:glycosyltransferase involved in cell wall biosynthesis
VTFVGRVTDEELAWLYANSVAVVNTSYEDYGLTILEAAAFGKPVAALHFGGFLDTVRDGETGVFFESPVPEELRQAISRLKRQIFSAAVIREHAAQYSEAQFVRRLREVVLEADKLDDPA